MPRQRGFAEEPQAFQNASDELRSVPHTRLKIDSAGRTVIPAEMRAAMLLKPGDTVAAQVVNGELRMVSREVIMRRIQEEAHRSKQKHPGDAVDELIAERREEALREDERYDRLAREAAEVREKQEKSR